MLTDGGARLPSGCRPSRLSEDEMARSGEVSRSLKPRGIRETGLLEGSENTSDGFGGVARPLLSDWNPRVDDLI